MARAKTRSRAERQPAAKRGGGAEKRKYAPTYGTASRVTQLALRLLTSSRRLAYSSIGSMVEVERAGKKGPPAKRTIERYVKALQEVFRDGGFGTLAVEKVGDGEKTLLFTPRAPERPAGESLEVLLAVNLLRSLEGTVLRENAEQLLKKLTRGSADGDRLALQTLAKKFYVVPFGVKRYDEQQALVGALVKALLRQESLDIHYRGRRDSGDVHVHRFEAYTLAIYKGGST